MQKHCLTNVSRLPGAAAKRVRQPRDSHKLGAAFPSLQRHEPAPEPGRTVAGRTEMDLYVNLAEARNDVRAFERALEGARDRLAGIKHLIGLLEGQT